MDRQKSKSKYSAKARSSDFCLDYSCALSVRKGKSEGGMRSQHQQRGKSGRNDA